MFDSYTWPTTERMNFKIILRMQSAAKMNDIAMVQINLHIFDQEPL